MNEGLWVFLGAVVGGGVSLFATYWQQRHMSKREQEASERDAAERRLHFQRDTLLELQEVLAALVRFYGRAQHLDEVEWHKSGAWGRSQLPDDVDSGIHANSVRMILLAERIADERVREHIHAFNKTLTALAMSRERDEATAIMSSAVEDYSVLQRDVGAVFRSL